MIKVRNLEQDIIKQLASLSGEDSTNLKMSFKANEESFQALEDSIIRLEKDFLELKETVVEDKAAAYDICKRTREDYLLRI